MRYLFLLVFLLPSCAGGGIDFANSAQYQGEIHPVVQSMTAVSLHVKADVARGRTREQIAADVGWAALNEVLVFLSTLQAAEAQKAAR